MVDHDKALLIELEKIKSYDPCFTELTKHSGFNGLEVMDLTR